MNRFFKSFLQLGILSWIVIHIVSCTASQKVVYVNNLQDSAGSNLRIAQASFENPIQKNDQLWITVGGSNINDLLVLNSSNGLTAGSGGASLTPGSVSIGYLVEADGKVKLPFLGKVQAEGLTRLQLETSIADKLQEYTKNPVVNVRFLNYNFSVLGEVVKPGRYNMTTERTTILEALSMAGDLTEMGKRENVLVIREVNGQREFARVNLLSKNLFNSPYFYLKTNDVIYIEPVSTRFIARTGVPQYISVAAVGISLLLTLINLIK